MGSRPVRRYELNPFEPNSGVKLSDETASDISCEKGSRNINIVEYDIVLGVVAASSKNTEPDGTSFINRIKISAIRYSIQESCGWVICYPGGTTVWRGCP